MVFEANRRRTWRAMGAVALVFVAVTGTEKETRAEPPSTPAKEQAAAKASAPPADAGLSQTTPTAEGKQDSASATLAYVGFATAGVGIVVGTIAGVMTLSRTSQLRTDCPGSVCPRDKQADIDSAKNFAGISDVSFAIALIGLVVGIDGVVLLHEDHASAVSGVHARPTIGLGSVGVEATF